MSPLTCAKLNHPAICHGFFTRKGGHSSGLYRSLNCGTGSDDDPENITRNRQTVLSALKIPDAGLCSLNQIHSAIVHRIGTSWNEECPPEGDAMVTDKKNLALAILTADCAPLLLADPVHGIIGAAHAGWKGALGGIAENTIEEMCRMGAGRSDIIAAIGPAIGRESYEVGGDFKARFTDQDSGYRRFFSPGRNRYLFDLKAFILHRLKMAGVDNIALLSHDTCADAEHFFSYRRASRQGEEDYGRQISVIMLL